jgi:hypothetical protein
MRRCCDLPGRFGVRIEDIVNTTERQSPADHTSPELWIGS